MWFLPAAAKYFLFSVFRFLRSQSAKNEKQLMIKYRSAEGYNSILDANA
jgi:hypothetical protein